VRVAGWILLIAGALLCVTLVWAPLGFLLMGVGLLSLLVAENNRKRASRPVVRPAAKAARVDKPVAPPMPEPLPVVRREPAMGMSTPAPSYDREAWQRLVDNDPELAPVAAVLADYGHQYVDELAREYMAAGDKTRLAEIVDGIIARAGNNAAPRGNRRLMSDARPPDAGSSAAAPRPDRQPRPLPVAKLKVSETLPDPAPLPVEPAAPEIAEPANPPPIVVEPAQSQADRNKTIVSADEELTAMLGRLAPDAATPSKT
jgi:hypothetical protein